jgi:hypothetical protein
MMESEGDERYDNWQHHAKVKVMIDAARMLAQV